MKRSIIIEGYDGAGKSHLCKQLSNYYNLPAYGAGPPPKNNLHALHCCEIQKQQIKKGAILDRVTPISRLCYERHIDSEHYWSLLRNLHTMMENACLIWCIPVVYKHVAKLYDTKEHLDNIERRRQHILDEYAFVMGLFPHFEYTYNIHKFEDLTKYIDEYPNEIS